MIRTLLMSRQFMTFLIVGSIATVAHYSLLIGLKEMGGLNPLPATLLGFMGGLCVSYALNKQHTFSRSRRKHREAFWRFFTVAAIGFALTFILGLLLMNYLHFPYLLAQALMTGIVLIWNFMAHHFWTFRI
jgi:putative flippase GtrA